MLKLNAPIYVWLARLVPWRSTRLDGTLCCQPRSWHRRGTVQRRNTESCGLGRVSPADTSSDSKSEGKTIVDMLIYQRLEETHLANLTQTDLHLIRDISLTFGHKNCLKKDQRYRSDDRKWCRRKQIRTAIFYTHKKTKQSYKWVWR